MPKSITVRDVPDETSVELASRAAAQGQSLQEYLRAQLEELARRPDMHTWVARVRARVESSETGLTRTDILDLRDAARR